MIFNSIFSRSMVVKQRNNRLTIEKSYESDNNFTSLLIDK